MNTDFNQIKTLAHGYGLVIRGGFNIKPSDALSIRVNNQQPQSLILLGNAGSSIWASFSVSAEFADGNPDPLNRWSERVGNAIARQTRGQSFFPFGGPPYQPFMQWAKRAESLNNSRLGMLIHPQYGLWHAYRMAIAYTAAFDELELPGESPDICARCESQACLNVCPADAFQSDVDQSPQYDVEACYGYLESNKASHCRTHTCQARLACPEGHAFHYEKKHAQFHMQAFYESIHDRFGGD